MARKRALGDESLSGIMSVIQDRPAETPLIPIADILIKPNQPRKNFTNIAQLGKSIEDKGVIEPLIVRPKGSKYELVAGERRLRAIKEYTQITEVPCIVKDMDDKEALEYSLEENLQREDLNPIEETEAIVQLGVIRFGNDFISLLRQMDNFDNKLIKHNVMLRNDIEEFFEVINRKWKSFLKNQIPLLSLPEDIKRALIENPREFRSAHAREIGKVEDAEIKKKLIKRVLEDNWSLSQLKQFVKDYSKKKQGGSGTNDKAGIKGGFIPLAEIPNVRLKSKRNGVTIDLNLKDWDLIQTLERLAELAKKGRLSNYIRS